MFLYLLNREQKELFYDLAYHIIMSDGTYSEEEQVIMRSYSVEMEMEFNKENVHSNLDDVVRMLNSSCGKKEKKIIIFEIIGLAMSDLNYDSREREIVSNALGVFGIEDLFGKMCEDKINNYLILQKEMNRLVLD